MADIIVKFNSVGFQQKLVAGDRLFILPVSYNIDSMMSPTLSIFPQGAAIVAVGMSFTPRDIVGELPAGLDVNYQPWILGDIDTASPRKWDTIIGAFSALKVEPTGGDCIVDCLPTQFINTNSVI